MLIAGLSDFVLLNDSVTFPPNSRPDDKEPFYVLVLGDNFIEIDEVFAVNLSALFPDFSSRYVLICNWPPFGLKSTVNVICIIILSL